MSAARRKRGREDAQNLEARRGAGPTRARAEEANRGANQPQGRGRRSRPRKAAARPQKGGRAKRTRSPRGKGQRPQAGQEKRTRRRGRNRLLQTANGLRVPLRRGELARGARKKNNNQSSEQQSEVPETNKWLMPSTLIGVVHYPKQIRPGIAMCVRISLTLQLLRFLHLQTRRAPILTR